MFELARAAIHKTRRAAGIALGTLFVGIFTVSILLLVACLIVEPDPAKER